MRHTPTHRSGSFRDTRRRLPRAICTSLVALLQACSATLMAQAAPAAPLVATGVQFDGTNDYVTFGQATTTLGAQSFTLELWFYWTGGTTTTAGTSGVTSAIPLLTKGRGEADAQDNRDVNYFLGIDYNSSTGVGRLAADFEDYATSGNHPVFGNTYLRRNTWNHAAATYDGAAGQWKLYLNGVEDGSATVATNRIPRYDSIQHAGLGTALQSNGLPTASPAGYFGGWLDEARIWNVARTQQEIRDNMGLELTSGTGLLGRWGLNDGAGTSAVNSIAGSPNGTLTNGPAWAGGTTFAIPDALGFGGRAATDAYVTFGDAAALDLAQFTIETWFKREATGVTTNTGDGGVYAEPLVTKGRGESEASNVDMNYFLGIRPTDGVLVADMEQAVACGGNPAGQNNPVIGATPIANGTWYHAAVTFDATQTWRLYLNGVLEATRTVGCAPRSDSIQHAALASALNSTGVAEGYFYGVLDEARIWNTARTAAEIQSTINARITGAQTGLVARWSLDEAAGRAVNGSAGTAINGTITNDDFGWTNGAPFNISFTPPAAPSDLSAAAAGANRVNLAWTDHADNESAFEIERCTGAGCSDFTALTTVAANVVTYPDTSTLPLTDYCYRVRATNSGGASPYSNTACATTLAENASALDLVSGTYVTSGDANATDLAQFTLEAWFRRDGAGTAVSTGTGGVTAIPLISNGAPQADNSNVDENYVLCIDNATGALCADFEEGPTGASPGQNHPVVGTTAVASGTWYHAAVTYDGTSWKLYLNGLLEATLAVGQPVRSDNISPTALATMIESDGTTTNGFFDGALDEVRIWNYARTEAEIQGTANAQLTTPQTGLVARWGLNEGAGTAVNGSAGTTVNGTIAGAGYTWIMPGAPFNLSFNAPPGQPALVSPADGASDVSTAPDLTVGVSDPDDADLTVTFYGRAKSAAGPDFTLAVLPDTQYYTLRNTQATTSLPACPTHASEFYAQTQWIVDHQAASNIVFVSHLGDMTDSGNNDTDDSEWLIADAAMDKLEAVTTPAGGIPFGFTPGNHDVTGGSGRYETWFGAARFAGRPYYGGHYGADNLNSYDLFSASGMSFIVFNIDCGSGTPASGPLDWADGLLKEYANRRGIVVCHDLLNTSSPVGFSTAGQAVYNALRDNANLFLMLGGHLDTEGRVTGSNTTNSAPIHALRSDYQTRTNGGNSWMRLMEFSPANNEIRVKTYAPCLDQYETDASSQFTLDYAMDGSGPFVQIGAPQPATSGGAATVNWTGLAEGAEYEWYVTVSDVHTTVTGPAWSFTTGVPGNHAPALAAIGNQSIAEGSVLTFTASATDEDAGDTWSFSLDPGPPSGAGIDASTGIFTWTPAEAQGPGAHPVTVRVTDNHGSSDTETITITVNEVNQAPVVGNPGNQMSAEGSTVSLQVQASDADLPANTLTYAATGLPPGLVIDAGTGLISGAISGATIGVPYNASVTVSDGQASDTEDFTWTVTEAAPRPCGGDPALVGCWPVDEGSRTVANDGGALPANNVAFAGTPSWTTGQSGGAISLNGTSQYGTTPDEASLDIANQITLAAWIRPGRQATQDLIKKAAMDATDGFELSLASADASSPAPKKVFVRFNQATAGNVFRVNSTSDYPFDGVTWMHVAATYDGAMIRLYINGIEESSMGLAAPLTIGANSLPLSIGAQSDGTRFFQGALDQVRVYNRALTAKEVAALVAGTLRPSGLTCTDLNTKPATTTTGEKPQSKVWRYAGTWWAVFPTNDAGASSAGTWLWKLVDTTWTEVLKLSDRTDTKADVKVVGDVIHALLYAGTNTQLVSAQYNGAAGAYALWSARPTPSSLSLPNSEIATIDVDSTGRMWLATRAGDATPPSIVAYYSDPPYSSWGGPITLGPDVMANDDIAVVTALPALNAIGVLWGNENPAVRRFGFRLHHDGAAPEAWDVDEVPASQSAIDGVGTGMADDHFNVAVASDGTLYAAVKTSYDTAGYPKMAFLVRRPAGTWDNLYGLDESGTRPVVLLDEANGVLTYVYTQSEGNNPIVYRQSALGAIAFGARQTLQSGSYNGVSGSKANYTAEFVTVFSNGSVTAGEICRPAGAAPQPPVPTITKDGDNVHFTWPKVELDVNNANTTVLRYQIYRSERPYFEPGDESSPLPKDQPTVLAYDDVGVVPSATAYYYVWRAVNAAGPSAGSKRTGKFTFTLTPGTAP